jgi:hypothetical protein
VEVIDVDTIKEGDRLRWRFANQEREHSGVIVKVRGYGHSKYYDAPYLDALVAKTGVRTDATFHSLVFPIITHLNGRRVDRSQWSDQIGKDSVVQSNGIVQISMPFSREDAILASLTTKTRKSLDEMSESHREHIERWEPHIGKLGGEHVWASCNRFPGRGGDGPMYVALKRGAKDYVIVDYNTEKMVKPKVLADGFETSGQLMEAFKEYRQMAKEERAAAKPASSKKASTKKTTAKSSTKKAPAKGTAKKAPAKKPVRRVKK